MRALWLVAILSILTSCAGEPPDGIGVRDGRLAPCPHKPNCYGSDDPDQDHRVDPFAFRGPPDEAWKTLREVVEVYPKTRIVKDTGRYMHVEFGVSIFGFVDDVEFHLRPEQGIIALRSASRLGYSDLGVNRRRIERIRRALQGRGVI